MTQWNDVPASWWRTSDWRVVGAICRGRRGQGWIQRPPDDLQQQHTALYCYSVTNVQQTHVRLLYWISRSDKSPNKQTYLADKTQQMCWYILSPGIYITPAIWLIKQYHTILYCYILSSDSLYWLFLANYKQHFSVKIYNLD